MMYSVFTCGFDDDCLSAATLSDGDTACAQGSRVITYHHSGAKGQMDGSIFFFFFLKCIWKITSPFALSCPVAKNSEVYKRNLFTRLCEDS